MADRLGNSMKLHLAGMHLDTLGSVGPRNRLRQGSCGELRTQRGTCDQGNQQAQRGDDRDGQLPSSSRTRAPRIHSGTNVRHETVAVIPASCENGQSPLCKAVSSRLWRQPAARFLSHGASVIMPGSMGGVGADPRLRHDVAHRAPAPKAREAFGLALFPAEGWGSSAKFAGDRKGFAGSRELLRGNCFRLGAE